MQHCYLFTDEPLERIDVEEFEEDEELFEAEEKIE